MLEGIGFVVVGHRGASAYEPENTLASIRRALDMGADAVEVDVRLSADGVPVVIHDDTVDRTTDGTGRVGDMSLDELRGLDAGGGERIPTLGEALGEVRGRGVLFLELKVREAAAPALDLVRGEDMLEEVLFTSFSAETLRDLREAEPSSHLGLIYLKPSDGVVGARRLGCEFVLPFHRMATARAVAFAHRMGLRVIPWVVDDPGMAAEYASRGVDGVATNRPDVMVDLRRSLGLG